MRKIMSYHHAVQTMEDRVAAFEGMHKENKTKDFERFLPHTEIKDKKPSMNKNLLTAAVVAIM